MPGSTHAERVTIGRLAAHTSWANTPDRTARTAAARANSPTSIEYHLARLDAERFAGATDEQRRSAAEAARKAYFQRLALKSAKSRRRSNGEAVA